VQLNVISSMPLTRKLIPTSVPTTQNHHSDHGHGPERSQNGKHQGKQPQNDQENAFGSGESLESAQHLVARMDGHR